MVGIHCHWMVLALYRSRSAGDRLGHRGDSPSTRHAVAFFSSLLV
jgi:hypothetical protein